MIARRRAAAAALRRRKNGDDDAADADADAEADAYAHAYAYAYVYAYSYDWEWWFSVVFCSLPSSKPLLPPGPKRVISRFGGGCPQVSANREVAGSGLSWHTFLIWAYLP